MHPVIIQGVAAERSRHLQAQAAAARRARETRRSRRARRSRPDRPAFMRLPRAWRDPGSRPAPQSLADPRSA